MKTEYLEFINANTIVMVVIYNHNTFTNCIHLVFVKPNISFFYTDIYTVFYTQKIPLKNAFQET